jgi:prepilin signal peptidase PulO-like enzyme (type II secretory pathway)
MNNIFSVIGFDSIIKIFTIVSLIVMGYVDIKKKSISIWMLSLFLCISIVLESINILCFNKTTMIENYILILVFTCILSLVSYLTRCLGLADCIIVFSIMIMHDFFVGLVLLFVSSLIAAVFVIIGLCLKKISKKGSIPFIPFLCVSSIIIFTLEWSMLL